MTRMKLFGISVFLIFFISCTHVRWVSKEKRGELKQTAYSTYYNNYYKFSFIPDGQAKLLSKKIKKILPNRIYRDLHKELKNNDINKVCFITNNNILYPADLINIGIIVEKRPLEKTVKISKFGATYSKDTSYIIEDSLYKVKYEISLKDKNLIILSYERANYPYKQKNFNNFYSFNFFEEVIDEGYFNSLKIENAYNNDKKISIQRYYWDSINSLKGDYLVQIEKLKNKEYDYIETTDNELYYDFLIDHFAFVNLLDSAKLYLKKKDSVLNQNRYSKLIEDTTFFTRLTEYDTAIIALAKKSHYLVFNESHYDWRHRYLVTSLLDTLYDLGYRTMAIEALSAYDDSLNFRKYPIQKSGYYTSEPYMANLVRSAFLKKMTVIAYEDTTYQNREFNQAKNILNLTSHSNSKVIVLCGYDHILKDTTSKKIKMAGYLSKSSNLYVGTINQSTYCDLFYQNHYLKNWASNYYSLKALDKPNNGADLEIINNIKSQPYENNNSIKNSVPFKIEIPDSVTNKAFIFIFKKKEYSLYKNLSVPIFIKKLEKGAEKLILNLELDEYIYIIQNKTGINLLIKDLLKL